MPSAPWDQLGQHKAERREETGGIKRRKQGRGIQPRGLGRLHSQLLEEKMTTHSSILVWEIPWTEDSGGLQSMGSQDLASKVPPSFSAAAICVFWYGWSTEKATKEIERRLAFVQI